MPKNKKNQSGKMYLSLLRSDVETLLAQIEVLGERLIQHGEMEDARQYQRLVRDLAYWAARVDQEEDEEESAVRYTDPFAPVLQRALDRGLTRLQVQVRNYEKNSTRLTGLIDEIQTNLQELIALKLA